jgi:serine acetyltransferase
MHNSVAWVKIGGGEAEYESERGRIGDKTYVGPNSIISKDVRIGRGCIIGAQSFVNVDVADGQKVAGSPTKMIRNHA